MKFFDRPESSKRLNQSLLKLYLDISLQIKNILERYAQIITSSHLMDILKVAMDGHEYHLRNVNKNVGIMNYLMAVITLSNQQLKNVHMQYGMIILIGLLDGANWLIVTVYLQKIIVGVML